MEEAAENCALVNPDNSEFNTLLKQLKYKMVMDEAKVFLARW